MSIRIFKLISGELAIGKLVAATPRVKYSTPSAFVASPGSGGTINPLFQADPTVKSGPAEVDLDTIALFDTTDFVIENPFILQYTQQGIGMAPMLPWCDPKKSPRTQFSASSVMCETLPEELFAHAAFIDSYKKTVSPLHLVTPVMP